MSALTIPRPSAYRAPRGNRTPAQVARRWDLPESTIRMLMKGPLDFFVWRGRELISQDAQDAFRRRVAQ